MRARKIAIAIAAALTIAVCVSGYRIRTTIERDRRADAIAALSDLKTQLDRYYLDNGFYPPSDAGLAALYGSTTYVEDRGMVVPRQPAPHRVLDPWGNSYFYESDGNHYILGSYGPGGNEGHGCDPGLTVRSSD